MQLSDDDKQLLMAFADGEELSASDAAHAATLEASPAGRDWLQQLSTGGAQFRSLFPAPDVSESRQAKVLAAVQAARPAELRVLGSENRSNTRRAVALGMSFAMAAGFVGWIVTRGDSDAQGTAAMVPSRGCAPSNADAGSDAGVECAAPTK